MQSVPREWLDFLRQQFPKDSRIQLTEIGGNPRPISPGSTGKLDKRKVRILKSLKKLLEN